MSWFWIISSSDNERPPVHAAGIVHLPRHFPIQLSETRRKVNRNECIHARMPSELARACRIKPDTPATLRCWATNSFRLVLWLWRSPLPSCCCPFIVGKLKCFRRADAIGRQALSRQLCVAATRAPMPMTTGWQWLRRHCWRRCTWVYSRDRGKQPMHTMQQIAHTPCMPSRGKRQRILSLINEQVTTADKGWKSHSQPCKPSMKAKGFVMELASWQSIKRRDLSPTPQLCELRFVFFTNQAMIWLHVLSNIKDSLNNERNILTA